jgi:response regulator RpfG family c-di-GMP phosphodiesterase
MRKEKVLIIEDNKDTLRLIGEILEKEGFECRLADNGLEGLRIFNSENHISAVLADIKMPGINGLEVLEEIKKIDPNMAVIMISGITDINVAVDAMKKGASGYITKPFRIKELISTLKRAIEKRNLVLSNKEYQDRLKELVIERTKELKKTIKELNEIYKATIEAFIKALDFREAESEAHSKRVFVYTCLLAKEIGINENGREFSDLEKGALLHDIGKIGIPDRIFKKPSPLTPEEWRWVREHPSLGYRIIRNIDYLKSSSNVILFHHERFDGKGYPFGIGGNEIPLEARLFAIADALDAITTDRPYRKARSFEYAQEEIKRCSGTQFDPELVKAFLSIPIEKWKEEKNKINGSLRLHLNNHFDISKKNN